MVSRIEDDYLRAKWTEGLLANEIADFLSSQISTSTLEEPEVKGKSQHQGY